MSALEITAKAVSETLGYHQVVFGWPADRSDWRCCADVDVAELTAWESRVAGYVEAAYGRSHPQTVSGFTLDWYAAIPGTLGGACFRVARRVPRLNRRSVAFRCHPDDHYPDGLAMLDDRFWCLPEDAAADQPEATVVPDETALAGVLRAEVRSHADDFLAGYVSGAKLPRRHRIGAFFDGLDTGVWYGGGTPEPTAAPDVLAATSTVLPGGTAEFREPSSVHVLTDRQGREHLSRRRMGCCYYYRSAPDGVACATCPRVDDAERAERYADLD